MGLNPRPLSWVFSHLSITPQWTTDNRGRKNNQNEEIVKCNRKELFSIRTNTTCSGQLIIGVEESNQNEEIVKCNREELFSNRANLKEVEIAF